MSQFGGGPRNAFGTAVGTLVGLGTCEQFWGPRLAALDSDGDGISNGAELEDPDGTWSPGMPNPGDPNLVTNPGVREALPLVSFIRGDANGDGEVDISDAVFTIDALFHRSGPLPCEAAADSNRDGKIDVSDAIFLLNYEFSGGRRLPAPFPFCGTDRAGLGCDGHAACE